jgi:hypothetical protein
MRLKSIDGDSNTIMSGSTVEVSESFCNPPFCLIQAQPEVIPK